MEVKWENLDEEEIFRIAYAGEMAKVLITAIDQKKDYEKFKKKNITDILNLISPSEKAVAEK